MGRLGRWILLVGLALQAVANALPAVAQSDDAGAVVNAFESASAQGDVEAALDHFADDAVVTLQTRSTQAYAGRDQVRIFLQAVLLRSRSLMRSTLHVDGPLVTWTERDEQPRQAFDARVQAIVRSGRIVSLLYQLGDPLGLSAAPVESGRELPTVTWPVAFGIGGLVMLILAFSLPPRRRESRSALQGRLLVAMRRIEKPPRIV
jgi:hypothetical protein